ncbi:LysR family transcriptional regulator, regulator for metE and metH [Paracoccus isoporae]|uniref:HTH-type transcriptional regulator MetR n=1 Tax=Paracoccus isoporae TaxID=591205 RepID=A0A1G6XJF7_9RHOB|nr:LysR family transcriptional regulator [Paracoccus isoporae]SDD77336.1 LysR family transcriptional regulator, regulator for metE and metH [Paracoccus isoporae]
MIDLQILSILREVDRLGSLTLAADRLCLTQSALSHAVRRFEQRHDVRLWTRDGRRLRLTDAGAYLLSLANRILPQLDHGQTVLEDFARGRRGALRIGMECHPCQDWLMRVVDPFLENWPDVDLDVTSAFQFGGLAALIGHEIDILVTPDPIARAGLDYLPVFDYELMLAVGVDHRLAGRARALPADLSAETLVTYPVAKERLDIYTRFLVPAGALPRRHRTVETTQLMLRLVASGRAVSATPDWLLREVPGISGLHLGAGIGKTIHLGMRTGRRPDFMEGFIDLARAAEI